MKSNLILDVAELLISQIQCNRKCTKIKIGILYQKFLNGNTLCKSKASFSEFKKIVQLLSPTHKNLKKHTKHYKLSEDLIYQSCSKLNLKLRPCDHIKH